MPDLPDILADAIDDPGAVPTSARRLVEYAGGRASLTRELSGMSGPPKRSAYGSADAYKAASTRWRTAARRVQRSTAAPGRQQRGQVKGLRLKPAESQRVKAAAIRQKWSDAVSNGVRARMRARVKVPTPGVGRRRRGPEYRDRTLPAGGPGTYISPDALIPALEAIDEDDTGRAAFEFQAAFEEAEGFPNFVIEEVYELKIWPEGTPEP